MSQLHAGMSIIEGLSSAMYELASHVIEEGTAKPSPDSGGMTAVKRAAGTKERQHQRQRSEMMVDLTDDNSDRLHSTEIPSLLDGVSLTELKQMTASHSALVNWARNRRTRGVTDAEYRKFSAICFGVIRDVNDFMRRVCQMELDAVRLHHHDALVHSDMRPTAASQTGGADAPRTDAYGVVDEENHGEMFEADLPPFTPYETPVSTRPSSPESTTGSPDDIDLMGA